MCVAGEEHVIKRLFTMNSFTFNDKHYLQIHGTAMGTRMAPSYANLFLAEFETDALSRAPQQPRCQFLLISIAFCEDGLNFFQTKGVGLERR